MTDVVLFHHALGLTPGVHAFADDLRAAGHVVHVPDLYEGRTFATVDEGVAHAQEVGFGVLQERGVAAVQDLPEALVYAGFSLGAVPAQQLAQNRPGARGLLLLHAAIPPQEFGAWPDGLTAQVHTMADDELGDVDVARQLAQDEPGVELFLYPGSGHLFAERGGADHDPAAAALLTERVLDYLARVG